MGIFEHSNYKDYLRALINASERRGLISEFTRASGCTHSYLSQVLNGKPDLTPDQAWALSEHLLLSKEEADYFFLLVLRGRAVSQRLKNGLDAKIKNLKSDQLQVTKTALKSTDTQIDSSIRDRYYATWSTGAIHILTANTEHQTVENISKRLNLTTAEIESTLKWLLENSLVKQNGLRYIHTGQSVHLPIEATIHNQINHLNWRLRGIQASTKKDNIHYTSVFSISLKDWDNLRSDLITFIENQRRKVQSSGSEEAFVFCCDLFQV